MKRSTMSLGRIVCFSFFLLPVACDSVNLGGIAGFFAPSATVEIVNDTDFTAVVDLRTSDANNIAADVLAEQEPVEGLGSIGPRQTASVRLTANGDLERIFFHGAKFSAGGNFPVGQVDDTTKLRRDIDFDGGDVIRIRLSGFIFNFQATVNVDRDSSSSSDGALPNRSDLNDDDEDDGMADLLDSLFG